MFKTGRVIAEINNQPLKIDKVFFASGSFFNIFTYPLLSGNQKTALKEPFTAALSETTARKIFGSTNVVGKRLELNRNSNYTITAVYKDAPVNTQIKPDILLSYATFIKFRGGLIIILKQPGSGMDALLMYCCEKVQILQ